MYMRVFPQLRGYLEIPPVTEGHYWDMIREVCQTLWQFICDGFLLAEAWIVKFIPSLALTVKTLRDAYTFVKTNPYPFHIIAWSIFFGPIAILIPSLLFLELAILFLFYASFLCHGFRLDSLEDRFHSLREYFMDTRESLFSVVESWSNVFNTWTSRYPPLLVFRLLSASLGLFTLIGLWTNWQFVVQ